MTAVDQIESAVSGIKAQRLLWLNEKPHVRKPSTENAEHFLADLRAEYRFYSAQRDRLLKARNALQALIDDCQMSMDELEQAASLVTELKEQARRLSSYATEEGV